MIKDKKVVAVCFRCSDFGCARKSGARRRSDQYMATLTLPSSCLPSLHLRQTPRGPHGSSYYILCISNRSINPTLESRGNTLELFTTQECGTLLIKLYECFQKVYFCMYKVYSLVETKTL